MTNTTAPKAGLLPFYLKLYDEHLPERRAEFAPYLQRVAAALEAHGIAVQCAPVCRVADEFEAAVRQMEADGAECLITLHLAYSPSLEALDVICKTELPIIILDATMDAAFGCGVAPERIMYNHGIHGVMDFASMLRRRCRTFEIVAGHDSDPQVPGRVAELARAAVAARALKRSRALRVGSAFAGMGDFSVAQEVLAEKLGVHVQQVTLDELDAAVSGVSDEAVSREVAEDRLRFSCELPAEVHASSVRVGLGLRRLLEAGGYQAFTVNFQAFSRGDRPSNVMPFLEICKAMGRGVGYAGEGDVLTASLVGALSRAFEAVTFTEVFCPDWAGDSLFLSHMGEINPELAADVPRVIAKPFLIGGALTPAVLTCTVKPGPAVLVNLAPGPDDTFSLIVVPVDVLAENAPLAPGMRDSVRMWVRPQGGIASFLEAYSRAGGTHHSALVLGRHAGAISAFGRMMGLATVEL